MQTRVRDLRRYEADVVLTDGSKVHLRPIRPDDTDAWLFLFSRLSPRTIYLPETDHNPVKVLSPGEGCCVADARILLKPLE